MSYERNYSPKLCRRCETAFKPRYAKSAYCDSCKSSCLVTGCGHKMEARGYCSMHLSRFYDQGHAGVAFRLREWQPEVCTIDGCDRPAKSLKLCSLHYSRQNKKGEIGPATVTTKPRGLPCEVRGCTRKSDAAGLCSMHYSRTLRGKDVGASEPGRKARGEGHVNRSGYKQIVVDGRSILEHRYVMEQFLGRRLTADETVHHRDGRRTANNIENLELWSSRHPSGQRVEDKVAWAVEMLDKYPQFANDALNKRRTVEAESSNNITVSEAISGIAGLI